MNEQSTCDLVSFASTNFLKTKEFKRFAEFCDACKRDKYIGVCYGPAGVGKSASAVEYVHWKLVSKFAEPGQDSIAPSIVRKFDTVFYTAQVINSAKSVNKGINIARTGLWFSISSSYRGKKNAPELPNDFTRLIIVDEADRLKLPALEQLRSIFDEEGIALILIGMPGIQKRLSRFPQLYSRVGFVHEFKMLSRDEVIFLLDQYLANRGDTFDPKDFTDSEALSAIIRITQGNFRLVNRLLLQIKRILEINGLTVVSKEVVEAARNNLVIGRE
jgi:DNA transposition AAA+ family ATPase